MSEGTKLEGRTGRWYQLGGEPLAQGGQGAVWPAVRDDGLDVAIKVANPSPEAHRALHAEAHLLSRLRDRNVEGVAEYLDELTWNDCPAIVMPHYPLHADAFMKRVVDGAGPRSLPFILRFAAQVSRHLGALHRVEVALPGEPAGRLVHRDVKPENILVNGEGQVRLADLGGTLVVAKPEAVRRAVFGSPLWAPFDQVLPGLAEANPTWDTYGLSVALFWWLTGTRPAYQADPSPMLTDEGMQIWRQLCAVADASIKGDRGDIVMAHRELERVRADRREADLVHVRGLGAIQDADAQALAAGVGRLAGRDVYGGHVVDAATANLVQILARALSPLSHPSPPNRFWDALELAKQLEAQAAVLDRSRHDREVKKGLLDKVTRLEGEAHLGGDPMAIPIETDTGIEIEPPPRTQRSTGAGVGGFLLALIAFVLCAAPLLWFIWQKTQPS